MKNKKLELNVGKLVPCVGNGSPLADVVMCGENISMLNSMMGCNNIHRKG